MGKRLTGVLAWGALAILIAVPSSEYLLGKNQQAQSTLVANPESGLLWQGMPDAQDVSGDETSVLADVGKVRNVPLAGARKLSTPSVLEIIPSVSAVEAAAEVIPETTPTAEPFQRGQDITIAAINGFDEDEMDFIPPYPAAYIERPQFVGEYAPVVAIEASQTTTVSAVNPSFQQNWRETSGSIVELDVVDDFGEDSFDLVPPNRIGVSGQPLGNWRAVSRNNGSFESTLPATRGSKVRLDLLQ